MTNEHDIPVPFQWFAKDADTASVFQLTHPTGECYLLKWGALIYIYMIARALQMGLPISGPMWINDAHRSGSLMGASKLLCAFFFFFLGWPGVVPANASLFSEFSCQPSYNCPKSAEFLLFLGEGTSVPSAAITLITQVF